MYGYPLLYHDMDKRVMIWCAPRPLDQLPSPPLVAGHRLRVVHSPNHLVEKILAFDAGLDDRAIEILKLGVCRDLSSRYSNALYKLGALPLNAGSIICAGRFIPGNSVNPAEKLLFVLLLQEQPLLPVCIPVGLPEYANAVARIDQMPEAKSDSGTWHSVDYRWACRVVKNEVIPLEIEMIVDPFLMGCRAAVLFHSNHVQLSSKTGRSTRI